MMYKVLAELDFRHFKETGLPVTNLEYSACKLGPVPKALHNEITSGKEVVLPDDMSTALKVTKKEFEKTEGDEGLGFWFSAKRAPNLKLFTPRQQRILGEVAEIYKGASATTASKASHEPDTPWSKTIKKFGHEGERIDYLDMIDSSSRLSRDEVAHLMEENRAFHHNYR